MAIVENYSLSQALTSETYAYKCWYNYNYGGNTMGISSNDIGSISSTWSNSVTNWQTVASQDKNVYDIDDDEKRTAYNNGVEAGKDTTDGYNGGGVTRAVVDGVLSVGSTGIGYLAKGACNSIAKGVTTANVSVVNTFAKESSEIQGQAGKILEGKTTATNKQAGAWVVALPLDLATSIAYGVDKPNEEGRDACNDLQDDMATAEDTIVNNTADMASAHENAEESATVAEEANDEANEELGQIASRRAMYQATIDSISAKKASGEKLTQAEVDLANDAISAIQGQQTRTSEITDDTQEVVNTSLEEMGEAAEVYDNVSTSISEIEGITDYAESFDKTTRVLCYVEAAAQGLNVADAGYNATKAGAFANSGGIFTAWAWAFVAMGTYAAIRSGIASGEQIQWAGEIKNEIDMREDVQANNDTLAEVHAETVEIHAGQEELVSGLELDIEDEDTVPDISGLETFVIEDDDNGTTTVTTTTTNNDDKDKE